MCTSGRFLCRSHEEPLPRFLAGNAGTTRPGGGTLITRSAHWSRQCSRRTPNNLNACKRKKPATKLSQARHLNIIHLLPGLAFYLFSLFPRPEAGPGVCQELCSPESFRLLSCEAVLTPETFHGSKLCYVTATQDCSSKGTLQWQKEADSQSCPGNCTRQRSALVLNSCFL